MTTLQYLARRLLASLSALLSTLPTVAMESVLVLLLALAFVAQKASAAPAVVHNAPKPSGPVPEKHHIRSGSDPHRQAGFSHAQILGTGAPALLPPGFGRDGPSRKAGRTALDVF